MRVFIALVLAYGGITTKKWRIGALPVLFCTAGFNFLPDGELATWPASGSSGRGHGAIDQGWVKDAGNFLAKDLGSELGKLSYPSSVHPLSLEGRHLQDRDFNAAWAFTAIFILFVSVGVLLLGLFGTTLADAWPIVLGALTNSLAISGHLDMPLGFAAMSDGLQITIALLMIAGRIELLILMVLFTSSFWRYMR